MTGLFKYDEVHRWAHWPYNDMSPRLTHGRGKRAPLQLPPRLAPPTASAVGPNHLTIKWKAEPAPPDSPFGSPHGALPSTTDGPKRLGLNQVVPVQGKETMFANYGSKVNLAWHRDGGADTLGQSSRIG